MEVQGVKVSGIIDHQSPVFELRLICYDELRNGLLRAGLQKLEQRARAPEETIGSCGRNANARTDFKNITSLPQMTIVL